MGVKPQAVPDALSKDVFIKGEATTAFIAENFNDGDLKENA
jgi:hypothetical protein